LRRSSRKHNPPKSTVIAAHEVLYIEYFPGILPAVALLWERAHGLEVTTAALSQSVRKAGRKFGMTCPNAYLIVLRKLLSRQYLSIAPRVLSLAWSRKT
jgi:hypothetical protein